MSALVTLRCDETYPARVPPECRGTRTFPYGTRLDLVRAAAARDGWTTTPAGDRCPSCSLAVAEGRR